MLTKYKQVTAMFLTVSTLCMFGCGTSGYQKESKITGYGYSEMQLSKDTYVVNYKSDNYTSSEKNEMHALHRAAGLCKAKGFKYFKVLDKKDNSNDPRPIFPNINIERDKDFGDVISINSNNTNIEPRVSLKIEMQNNYVAGLYDAESILANF